MVLQTLVFRLLQLIQEIDLKSKDGYNQIRRKPIGKDKPDRIISKANP